MNLEIKTWIEAIDDYNFAFLSLLNTFLETYFKDEDWEVENYYYVIWSDWWLAPSTVWIGEYFIEPTTMWECLYHKIPEEIFHKWYWESLESHQYRKEWFPNLVHYFKWAPIYTKEEREKDKKKIEDIKWMLEEQIKNLQSNLK